MESCKQSTRSLAQQYCTPRPKGQPFSQVDFGILKACEPPRKAEFSKWKTLEPVGISVQRSSGPFCDNHQHTQCSETLSSVPLLSLSDRWGSHWKFPCGALAGPGTWALRGGELWTLFMSAMVAQAAPDFKCLNKKFI